MADCEYNNLTMFKERRVNAQDKIASQPQNLELAECDSDIDEVLCESLHFTEISSKVAIIPEFFIPGTRSETKGSSKGNPSCKPEMAYDSNIPPRTQIIGATPEYIEHLKSNPGEMEKLVPIFNVDQARKPSLMYWNFPKAIADYGIIEHQMTSVIPNGGIKKLISRTGKGNQLARGSNVLINFYVYVEGITSCVESNQRWKKPHSFVLGAKEGGGIPVINLGTLTMRAKEIAIFLAKSEYAYGKMGMGAWIPPKKRVLCVIEVLSKLPSPSESSTIINMVPAERRLLGFEEIYNFTLSKKADGNKDLGSLKNVRALKKYIQAATCLSDAIATNEQQQKGKYELLHQLYGNIFIASFRSNQFAMAIEFSQKAIELPIPEEHKAYDYLRCAKALYCEQKWEQAKPYIDMAAELLSDLPDVITLQNYIHAAIKETEKKSHPHINPNP